MPKKKKSDKLLDDLGANSLDMRVTKFSARALKLKAEIKDFLKTGKELLEETIKDRDFSLFGLVVQRLYAAKEAASLSQLQSFFKDWTDQEEGI